MYSLKVLVLLAVAAYAYNERPKQAETTTEEYAVGVIKLYKTYDYPEPETTDDPETDEETTTVAASSATSLMSRPFKSPAPTSAAMTTPTPGKDETVPTPATKPESQPSCPAIDTIFVQNPVCLAAPAELPTQPTPTDEADEQPKGSTWNNELLDYGEITQIMELVDHSYYKSALVCNESYFSEFWTNITNGSDRIRFHPRVSHNILRQAYRDYAYDMRLPFDFPYYGHYLKRMIVSTRGYILTGPASQKFHARDQCIAPLMGDWDISLDEESAVVLYESHDSFTVSWEDMIVPDKKHLKFSFAATMFRNGDIFLSYKDLPIAVQEISDRPDGVFVGISDSYFLNKIPYLKDGKITNNYSRIPFTTYDIKSSCILELIALPSCPIHKNCNDCIAHEKKYGSFNCTWCESLGKCTNGADFYHPYLADCHFTNYCNETFERFPAHYAFFKRILSAKHD